MKIDDYAYTAVDRMAVNLRIEYCTVPESHEFRMPEATIERFVYIISGGVTFSVGCGSIRAVARDMVYLPRATAYSSRWHAASDFVVVDVSLSDADGNEFRFGDIPDVLFHDEFCVYDGLLRDLADKETDKDPFNWLERTSLCMKLLCEMARDTKSFKSSERELRIRNAITYLENNFTKDFSVEELAKMSYMSAAAFRRIFFECKGMSPVDYRNTLRIRRAAEFLKNDKYTVAEIAERVGIYDIKYFGKLFRRHLGTTPRAFRNREKRDTPPT